MKATGKIKLLRNDNQHKDHEVELELVHAENLLQLQVKHKLNHYSLPKNSQYEFKDGHLNRKSSSRAFNKAETDSQPSEGQEA